MGGRSLAGLEDALLYAEWHHFVTAYPEFGDREREFIRRLVRAVIRAFPDPQAGNPV